MSAPDQRFFQNSLGITHPRVFPFHVSETNPNPTGRCLCEITGNVGPYVVFPGDMMDVSAPRPVVCAGCVPCMSSLLEGAPTPDIPEVELPAIEIPDADVVEDDEVEGL